MKPEDGSDEPKAFAPKQRGRPKDLQLRLRIVESATELFLEHGMQAVSVESIADRAQVSNRTVYSHFQNKEALLWEVLVHAGEKMRPMRKPKSPTTRDELRMQLIDFGIAFVTLVSSPTIIRLGKLMISESARHPALARQFFDWGPRQVQLALATLLEEAANKKLIRGQETGKSDQQAAHHLLAMWQGTKHFEQQLELCGPMTKPQIRQHATACVDFFLRAV
jgi:TetR/AcrR family transcriptional regulator, mexJK operon transcriptional repressor